MTEGPGPEWPNSKNIPVRITLEKRSLLLLILSLTLSYLSDRPCIILYLYDDGSKL